MKLIIDIQDFVYNHIKEFNSTQLYDLNVISAIKNGTTLDCHDEQIRAEEKKRVLEFVLNQIPCEKNCNCCLRNGISDCFVPTKDMDLYIKDIVSRLKEQLELDLPIEEMEEGAE